MNDTPANPHPFRLNEGDTAGFSDAGERVAVVWPHGAQTVEAALLDALRETGATFPDVPGALVAIERAFDMHGDRRAAEILVTLFSRLPGGRRGDELRSAFLGMLDDESLAQTAARHGVCKVTWFKTIQRLRRRLFGKTANAPDYL